MSLRKPEAQAAERAVDRAYRAYAERIRRGGYRSNWFYVATKALSDWALLADLDLRGARILNVGSCEPIDELFFARQPVGRWIALDRSQPILQAAREVLDEELSERCAGRFGLCAGDAARLPFRDATFDLVVSFSALEHLPDPADRRRAFSEIARVTRPGGHAAVTVSNRNSLFYFAHRRNMREGSSDYGYAYLYRPGELRQEIERAGLTPLRFQSEFTGVVRLPSYLPGWLRQRLRWLGYLGERIGYLARREGE